MKKLEIKIYSIKKDNTELEHIEIENFKHSLDKDDNLEYFEFTFRPLTNKCRVIAKIIKKK